MKTIKITPKTQTGFSLSLVLFLGIALACALILGGCAESTHVCNTYGTTYSARAVKAQIHSQSNYRLRKVN